MSERKLSPKSISIFCENITINCKKKNNPMSIDGLYHLVNYFDAESREWQILSQPNSSHFDFYINLNKVLTSNAMTSFFDLGAKWILSCFGIFGFFYNSNATNG